MIAYCSPTAQNSAHIDHCAFSHNSTDVKNRTHHDDGIRADHNLLPDYGTGFNTGRDVFHIYHRNRAVSAVIFDHDICNFIPIIFKNRRKIFPFSKED